MKLKIENFNEDDLKRVSDLPITGGTYQDGTLIIEFNEDMLDMLGRLKQFGIEYKNIHEIV